LLFVVDIRPEQMQLVADRARANDTSAVALMPDLGFNGGVLPEPPGFMIDVVYA
jgi:hypothetical protein